MDTRSKVGFAASVGALLVLYFVSGSPISLYSMWQVELGMSNSEMAMISMWYLLGTVIPLLFLPRISNHLGRRPVTVTVLLISISGALTFAMVDSPDMIMAGRFMQGLVSGFGSSTVSAYVVDLSAGLPRWVAPAITSSAPTIGLAMGAFVSGGLVGYGVVTPSGYFQAAVVLILAIVAMVLFARETMPRSPGLLHSLRPQMGIPEGCGRLFMASCTIFVGTWVLGGFSQSFSATMVHDYLGHNDAFLSAVVLTSLLIPIMFGSIVAKRFDVRTGQRFGMGVFTICAVMMYVAVACLGSLPLYCLFAVVAGFAHGIAFTSSVTELISHASKAQRAGTFSTIYLVSYGGPAMFNLVIGMVPGEHSLEVMMSWFIVMIVVMFASLLVLTAKRYELPPCPTIELD